MKKLTSIGTALALIVAASGCANITMVADAEGLTAAGQPEHRKTTMHASTLFTAKQVVTAMKGKNTSRSQEVGVASVDQESSMAEFVQLITALAPLLLANQQNNRVERVVYVDRLIYTNGPAMIPVFVPGP